MATMPTVYPTETWKVWDELCGTEGTADIYKGKADWDATDAAKFYAKNDFDGHHIGLYEAPRPIMVRTPNGSLVRCHVWAEMEPVFRASSEFVEVKP